MTKNIQQVLPLLRLSIEQVINAIIFNQTKVNSDSFDVIKSCRDYQI
jgi:CMP-N-acetylneuraminic acid synthetase